MAVDLNELASARVPQIDLRSTADIIAGIAYHEAGHTVTGMTFGMSLASTRVHTVDVDGQMCWTGTTTWNVSWARCFDLAVELAAGEAAKNRYLVDGGMDPATAATVAAAPHDRDMAVKALAECNYTVVIDGPAPHPDAGTTWAQAVAAAEKAVDELWQQIAAVAEALIAAPRRELSGDEVSSLTGIANALPSAPAA